MHFFIHGVIYCIRLAYVYSLFWETGRDLVRLACVLYILFERSKQFMLLLLQLKLQNTDNGKTNGIRLSLSLSEHFALFAKREREN